MNKYTVRLITIFFIFRINFILNIFFFSLLYFVLKI